MPSSPGSLMLPGTVITGCIEGGGMLSGSVLLQCNECWLIEQRTFDELEGDWPVCDNPACGSRREPLEVLKPVLIDEDLIERNISEVIEQAGIAGLDRLIEVASAARDALSDA
jgi:hypothetical protein